MVTFVNTLNALPSVVDPGNSHVVGTYRFIIIFSSPNRRRVRPSVHLFVSSSVHCHRRHLHRAGVNVIIVIFNAYTQT